MANEDILRVCSEYLVDLLSDYSRILTGCRVSRIFTHSPRWPAHVPKTDDSHLDLEEQRDSQSDADAECSKQCDATRVCRDDARHERLYLDAEHVSCVGQEKPESHMSTALSTVRGLCKRPKPGVSMAAYAPATLRDCDADLSGPLLQGFSRSWAAAQRLEPTQDDRIGWKPSSVDMKSF